MKLSCLPVSYFGDIIDGRMSIAQWAAEGASLGLDAIDLSILLLRERTTAYLRKIREEIEAIGERVAVMNAYPDFTHPDPVERKNQLCALKDDIAAAAQLGAEMVRVTAGQAHPQTPRKKGITWAVEGLTGAIDTAQQNGIRLVFENHSKPGVWQYPDFCLPSDLFLEIAGAIEDTEIGILFDTANPIVYGDDPLRLLNRVIDRGVCVHLADTSERGALKPVLIGTGLVPFDTIFARLKRAGYRGWLSIEEASGMGGTGVAEAVRFVRNRQRYEE